MCVITHELMSQTIPLDAWYALCPPFMLTHSWGVSWPLLVMRRGSWCCSPSQGRRSGMVPLWWGRLGEGGTICTMRSLCMGSQHCTRRGHTQIASHTPAQDWTQRWVVEAPHHTTNRYMLAVVLVQQLRGLMTAAGFCQWLYGTPDTQAV